MKRPIYYLFVLLLFSSCMEEEISLNDLKLKNADLPFDIVVDGMISTEKTIYKVRLHKPLSFLGEIVSEPVNDAIVLVRNREDEYVYQLDSMGIYSSIDSIQGIPGEEYRVEVRYNNELYTASDIIPLHYEDRLLIPFEKPEGTIDANWVQAHFSFHNFGFDKPLVVMDDNSWNFKQDSVIHIDIHNFSDPLYLHRGSPPQGVFPTGWGSTGIAGELTNMVTFINMTISERYYEYLLSVFNETDWKGGIFSTIEGNSKTNISDGGTGFFYCTHAKRISFTFQDIGDNYVPK